MGGHRATKDELIAPVAALGYHDVDTFLASGNILLRPDDGLDPDAAAMTAALEAALGFPVPVTVRSPEELDALAAVEPFDEVQLTAAEGTPQIILLFDRSDGGLASAAEAAEGRSCPEDLLVIDRAGGAVHWLPMAGISGSGIDPTELIALFGVHTVRTANTIRRLTEKC